MPSAIIVEHVSKEFILRHNRAMGLKTRFLGIFHKNKREKREYFLALDDLSFTLEQGEALGLLGHNGSGKVPCCRSSRVYCSQAKGASSLMDELRP